MAENKTYRVEYETADGLAGSGLVNAMDIQDAIAITNRKYPLLVVTGVTETTMIII